MTPLIEQHNEWVMRCYWIDVSNKRRNYFSRLSLWIRVMHWLGLRSYIPDPPTIDLRMYVRGLVDRINDYADLDAHLPKLVLAVTDITKRIETQGGIAKNRELALHHIDKIQRGRKYPSLIGDI